MPIILTTQTPPVTGGGAQTETTVLVPALSTMLTDSVSFTNTVTAKWLVTAILGSNVRFFEVSASSRSTTDPSYTVFGDTGDRIKVKPQVDKTVTDLTLSIINNETSDVTVVVARMYSAAA